MKLAISLVVLLIVFSGYIFNESFAEVSTNQAFLLEGSGFAVTEEQIKFTEIDLGLSSQDQRGSTINFVIEDGFITLDDEEFIISELEGKFLREGRYIRINGNVESSSGEDTTISFFGRLVAESKDATIYGFTGRITTSDDTYKIIYTTKLSTLSKINTVTTTIEEPKNTTLRILKGASSQGGSDSYIGLNTSGSDSTRLGYFSKDRISVEPGSTITLVNNDVVSHSILSGKENYGDRHNPFDPDGRISTGNIAPGGSVNITFDDAGFYRLYDPDYPWMKIVAYVFPSSDNLVLRQGQNLGN
ncbi:cupredoxin domain-containing protein [Nitrosopumilus sp. S6]